MPESPATSGDGLRRQGSSKRVKAGDYWLYCMIERPRHQRVLWNVKTTVKFYDETKVTINNDNIGFRSDPRPELDQKTLT
jgi:hypothetical protein